MASARGGAMVLAAGTPQEGATGSVHSVTAFVVRCAEEPAHYVDTIY